VITFSRNKESDTREDCSAQDQFGSGSVLEKRVQNIYEMMNGKKFGAGRPKLLFGSFAQQDVQEDAAPKAFQVAEAVRVIEDINVQHPLFAVLGYYRYYIFQGKYSAIVKFNLQHARYYEKRDEIIEIANDLKMKMYWQACLLSLICV